MDSEAEDILFLILVYLLSKFRFIFALGRDGELPLVCMPIQGEIA